MIAAVVCGAFLLLPGIAFAQGTDQPIRVSTQMSFGAIYGEGYEYVYNQQVATNYKNSELDWPLAPLFYTGAEISLNTSIGVFASLGVREGLPGKTGTMSDSDFLDGDGVRTNLSESTSDAERAVLLDLKAGYQFALGSAASLGFYAGFSYMDFKWSARDGYYQYPTSGSQYYFDSNGNLVLGSYPAWSASETQTPLYGVGIFYEQAYVLGSVGVKASYQVFDALSLDASFSFSPLAYCYTADNHVLREVDFYSTLSGGLMVEPHLGLTWTIVPGATLKLTFDYRYLFSLIGDISQVDEGTTSTASDGNYYAGPDSTSTSTKGSGAALWMLDASLLFSFQL